MRNILTILKMIRITGMSLIIVALVAGALLTGYAVRGWVAPPSPPDDAHAEHAEADPDHDHAEHAEADGNELWTCSMHPQVQLPEPGLCPICNMDLIPLDDAPTEPRTFTTSPEAAALMGIRVRPVERRTVHAEVRLSGRVTSDERRIARISAWVPGRIERLFVDFTGTEVRRGDPMVELYSPELYSAQTELLRALESRGPLRPDEPGQDLLRSTTDLMVGAARERLRLWGLTEDQIREIEERGHATDTLTITAPAGGTVIRRHVEEGEYVRTGSPIYSIADLSHVWAMFDAYESDLPWLRCGQEVEFTARSYPGETFRGRVSFVSPTVTDRTRAIPVRVDVPNEDRRLKPDMLIRGIIHAALADGGLVAGSPPADKPADTIGDHDHHEDHEEGTAACDMCRAWAQRADTAAARYPACACAGCDMHDRHVPAEKPLVIPASAPLITGKRAVVYVRHPDAEDPTFVGREIELGPRAGNYYVVRSGLHEGELVAVSGNFKIDSALQIRAEPSMMTTRAGEFWKAPPDRPVGPIRYETPLEFRERLGNAIDAYFDLARGLADDDLQAALAAVIDLNAALGRIDAAELDDDARTALQKRHLPLAESILKHLAEARTLDEARAAFLPLSEELTDVVRHFGVSGLLAVHRLHCPMAFDDAGAEWLQPDTDIRNPYYGAVMLRCGEVVETLHQEDAPVEFRRQMGSVVREAFTLSDALAGDDFERALEAVRSVGQVLGEVDPGPLPERPKSAWQGRADQLAEALGEMTDAGDLDEIRRPFDRFSEALIAAVRQFGVDGLDAVRQVHCPMAFDNRGADWLQPDEEIRNPYYGAEMFRCGEVVETLHSE